MSSIGKEIYSQDLNDKFQFEEPNLFDFSNNPQINTDLNYSIKSPLRYPGGKTRGVEFITRFFPKNLDSILSPFLGGGSIELITAAKGTKVYGYDIFNPLIEFWQCIISNPIELATEVEKYYPLSKEMFYELQKKQSFFQTKIQRAAVFFVLNRTSFSGSTLSGGMSPEHPRFTLSSIERIKKFHNPNLIIDTADFKESLVNNPHMFTYLDPPYLIKSTLYGKKGNAHKGFDHLGLSKILKERLHWILSYNDCPEIREIYAGFHILTPNWKYGMSNDKSSKEVLIFSEDFIINGHFKY